MPAVGVPLAIAAVGAASRYVSARNAAKAHERRVDNANRLAEQEAAATRQWQAGLQDPNSAQGQAYAGLIGPQVTSTTGSYTRDESTQGQSGKNLSPEFSHLVDLIKERAATAGAPAGMLQQGYRNAALAGQADAANIANAAARGMNADVLRVAQGGGQAAQMRQAARAGVQDLDLARKAEANQQVSDAAQMLLRTNFSDQSHTAGTRGSRQVGQGDYAGALALTRPQDRQIFV